MKTFPSCIGCLFNQLNRMAKLHGIDKETHQRMAMELVQAIPSMDLNKTPPELARTLLDILSTHTGNHDPYEEIKLRENERARSMLPDIRKQIEASANPLETAVRFAAAANVIDYGVPDIPFLESKLEDIAKGKFAIYDFETLVEYAERARRILVVGDNTGEVFYDRLLIEQLPNSAEIFYAVRSIPAINDVLLKDAMEAGIHEVAHAIESGSRIPGTVVRDCNEQFRNLFEHADLIMSKGQGNFETLLEEKRPIVFLFAIKCETIAEMVGHPVGSLMVMATPKYDWK